MTSPAPIALFVFNRPLHTKATLESLSRNPESSQSDIFVFSDGPRSAADEETVGQVRDCIANASGFRSMKVVQRSENFGLARSIISGVTEILETSDRIIVLEDDLITSPHFLKYMNAALDCYIDDERVGSVHAYMYPIEGLPDFFFMKGGDCWGWGTWRDRWRLLETDGGRLLLRLTKQGLLREFDKTGGNHMVRMLTDQIRGINSSWFIRWHASLFLNGKLTLQPGRSFVQNIGSDNSGTHCSTTDMFDVVARSSFDGLPPLEVDENRAAVDEIRRFFDRSQTSAWYRRLAREVLDEIRLQKIVRSVERIET